MLCKISLKNIRKSFKDYAVYFFTLILGVAIFYVFNAIDSQTVLLDVKERTYEVIKLMTNMLSGVSVFISFVLGFLIIYASRFLIKRRNKEFGIYLTLGMGKRKISMILFMETLLIGIISLGIGLVLGVGLSQFMSLLVVNMFEADLTKFTFVFSSSACIKTLAYFAIMYLIVMIFNTIIISRCKLIDLLYSSRKSEKVKMKNPILCTIIFIISVCILSYAYYMVTGGLDHISDANFIFIPIILGAVSTFFIFFSLSGLLIKIFQSMKKVYYKGLNCFTLRQFSSKINTTVFSTTIICLMLFLTICILSSALAIKNSMTINLKTLAPIDIEFSKTRNVSVDRVAEYGYSEKQSEDTYRSIEETLAVVDFDVEKYLDDMVKLNLYVKDELTFKDTLGSEFDKISKQFPFLDYNTREAIIKVSDYNRVAKLLNNDTYSLDDDEYIIVGNYESMTSVRDKVLKKGMEITINGKKYKPKYNKCMNGFIEISANSTETGIIIVPDSVNLDDSLEKEFLLANYKGKTKEEKERIEEKVLAIEKHSEANNILITANTKIDITEASVGLGALVTFIGLYLGIIFLISSAAILALKELSESADNKARFSMIRKLGADEKTINKALFKQIGIFFMFPLLLAIIHSIFGIKFAGFILETFGKEGLIISIVMTAIFIVIIYGGYFIITYYCSKNIIKER